MCWLLYVDLTQHQKYEEKQLLPGIRKSENFDNLKNKPKNMIFCLLNENHKHEKKHGCYPATSSWHGKLTAHIQSKICNPNLGQKILFIAEVKYKYQKIQNWLEKVDQLKYDTNMTINDIINEREYFKTNQIKNKNIKNKIQTKIQKILVENNNNKKKKKQKKSEFEQKENSNVMNSFITKEKITIDLISNSSNDNNDKINDMVKTEREIIDVAINNSLQTFHTENYNSNNNKLDDKFKFQFNPYLNQQNNNSFVTEQQILENEIKNNKNINNTEIFQTERQILKQELLQTENQNDDDEDTVSLSENASNQ